MEFEKKKLQWLEFSLLGKYSHIVGATFLRHGGVSAHVFSSLNLSDNVGDHPDCVKVNRYLVKRQLGVDRLVFAKQVHGNNVVMVTKQNIDSLPEADGLITKEKNIALGITHADCQAALFFDPKNEIIAAAHAGWKGLVTDIYANIVNAMKENGSQPEDIVVCISPSLGPDHAEFKNYKVELPESLWSFRGATEYYFNLWEIAQAKLRDIGILDMNLEIVKTCTFSETKDYFSYRREKLTGRNGTFIAMK